MDTPKSIYPIYGKLDYITEIRKGTKLSTYPRGDNPPMFISVVFTGRGRVLKFHIGDNAGSVNGPAIRDWQGAHDKWSATDGRPNMAPMWDRYYAFVVNDQVRYLRDR